MKNRHLYILVGIFLFFTVGLVIQKMQGRPEVETRVSAPLELLKNKANAARITLAKGGVPETVTLVKKDGVWTIPAFGSMAADSGKIEMLLTEIGNAEGEFRGSGESSYSDYGIAPGQAYEVRIQEESGADLAHFFIGTKKADYRNLFVRTNASDQVHVTSANLLAVMNVHGKEAPKTDFWADLSLAKFHEPSLNEIEIYAAENGTEIPRFHFKKEKDWRALPDFPFPLDGEKVKAFASQLKHYRAESVQLREAGKDYGFDKPQWRISLKEKDKEAVILIGKAADEGKNTYYAQTSPEALVYTVTKYVTDSFQKNLADFLPANPFGIDPSDIESVEIRAGKERATVTANSGSEDTKAYLEGLKLIQPDKFVQDKPKFGKYSLEIKRAGQPPLSFHAAVQESKDTKRYLMQQTGSPLVFEVSEKIFQQFFANLTRFKK